MYLNYFIPTADGNQTDLSFVALDDKGCPCDGLYDLLEMDEIQAMEFELNVIEIVEKMIEKPSTDSPFLRIRSRNFSGLNLLWWISEAGPEAE